MSRLQEIRTKVLETLNEHNIPYEATFSNDFPIDLFIYIETGLETKGWRDEITINIRDGYDENRERFMAWDEIEIDGFGMETKYCKYYDFIEELKILINKRFRILYDYTPRRKYDTIDAIYLFEPEANNEQEALKLLKKKLYKKAKIITFTNYNESICYTSEKEKKKLEKYIKRNQQTK